MESEAHPRTELDVSFSAQPISRENYYFTMCQFWIYSYDVDYTETVLHPIRQWDVLATSYENVLRFIRNHTLAAHSPICKMFMNFRECFGNTIRYGASFWVVASKLSLCYVSVILVSIWFGSILHCKIVGCHSSYKPSWSSSYQCPWHMCRMSFAKFIGSRQ